jgi:hypothetical protein
MLYEIRWTTEKLTPITLNVYQRMLYEIRWTTEKLTPITLKLKFHIKGAVFPVLLVLIGQTKIAHIIG